MNKLKQREIRQDLRSHHMDRAEAGSRLFAYAVRTFFFVIRTLAVAEGGSVYPSLGSLAFSYWFLSVLSLET